MPEVDRSRKNFYKCIIMEFRGKGIEELTIKMPQSGCPWLGRRE